MTYSRAKAEEYWSDRVRHVEELRAVLSWGLPSYVNAAYHRWETTLMLKALGDVQGKAVLDLGCGVGRLTELLVGQDAYVTSVDNSAEMLSRTALHVLATGRAQHARLVKASADEIPVCDEAFDAVICFGVLEHLPTDVRARALREMMRVVRPSGLILLIVHNNANVFFASVPRYKMRQQQDDGYFVMPMDKAGITNLLTEGGFAVEVVGNDFMYSFARHALERMSDVPIGEDSLRQLFEFCSRVDVGYTMNAGVEETVADHFMLRATRLQPVVSSDR